MSISTSIGRNDNITDRVKRNSFYRRNRDNIEAWSVIGPVLLYMLIFSIAPVIFVCYLSFTEWNGFTGLPEWVGVKNYVKMATPTYLNNIWQTFYIGIIIVALTIILPFFGALLLNLPIKGRDFYRTIWYIPVLTSSAVISQIVLRIIDPMTGPLNAALQAIGFERIEWQLSTFWMVTFIIVFQIWKSLGSGILLYLAGLQSIDNSIYEAAIVDGASAVRRLFRITIPLMRPIFSFVIVTSLIAIFQLFDPIYLISKGEPNGTTSVLVYRLYKDAFTDFQLGMASTISILILFISLIGTLVTMKISNKKG